LRMKSLSRIESSECDALKEQKLRHVKQQCKEGSAGNHSSCAFRTRAYVEVKDILDYVDVNSITIPAI
jgi:hypothetical protein